MDRTNVFILDTNIHLGKYNTVHFSSDCLVNRLSKGKKTAAGHGVLMRFICHYRPLVVDFDPTLSTRQPR